MKKSEQKIIYKALSIVLAILIIFIANFYSEGTSKGKNNIIAENSISNVNEIATNEELEVYYIDVGQADSILIKDKNKSILIDAGNNDDGDLVVDFIKSKKITKLDYVVGTHPHEDHIGGLDDIINSFEIGEIYMPKKQANTKTFEDVLDAVKNKGLKITSPKIGDKFKLDTAECEIMEVNDNAEEANQASIIIRLVYGEKSFLFTGDAEKENENSRKWPKTDVLKVGHHGSTTSSSTKFLEQLSPEIAIIQVGKDNDYGHPKDTILKRFQKLGTKIYRTDENGTIYIKCDGKKLKIITER